MIWFKFKVRHIELFSFLIFVILLNLFDWKFINVASEWFKMFSFFIINWVEY